MKRKTVKLLLSCLMAFVLLVGIVPQAPALADGPGKSKEMERPGDGSDRDQRTGTASDKIEASLLAKVLENPTGKFAVIVTKHPGKGTDARAEIERTGNKIDRSLPIIGGASAKLPGIAILALSRNRNVDSIYEDSPVKLLGSPVSTISTLAVRAPDAWALGYTGKGIGVAVLDSGVYQSDDLKDRIKANVTMVAGTQSTGDPGGHGTHVAGIVGGNGAASDGARQGIAPKANIISVKVTDDVGAGSLSSVIEGIQWAVHNKTTYNIRVMNISLGSTVSRSYKDDPLDAAVEVAWFSGIVVVVAAGNDGPAYGTINSPGNDPYVITVGALDDMGTATRADDTIASYSSRGPTPIDKLAKPDVVAPGRKVISLRSPGSYLDKLLPDRVVDSAYFRLSGTSMAAPVVSGIAAMMLQRNPALTPNQVKFDLTQSSAKMKYDANTAGAGSVDALAAVTFQGKGIANRGGRPSSVFARAIYPLAKGAPLIWRNLHYAGRKWTDYTWDNLTWDDYTWDNYSWEDVTWETLPWSNYTWEDYTWDNATWEDYTWDDYTWDNATWEVAGID